MIDQLKELAEKQKELDARILKEHGFNEYNDVIAQNVETALFVELGELMNELPTRFKHWKAQAKDDREKALEEYADCLHFSLSLANYYDYNLNRLIGYEHYRADGMTYASLLRSIMNFLDTEASLQWLFTLGNKIGFTWEEVYDAYNKKNKINHKRQDDHY